MKDVDHNIPNSELARHLKVQQNDKVAAFPWKCVTWDQGDWASRLRFASDLLCSFSRLHQTGNFLSSFARRTQRIYSFFSRSRFLRKRQWRQKLCEKRKLIFRKKGKKGEMEWNVVVTHTWRGMVRGFVWLWAQNKGHSQAPGQEDVLTLPPFRRTMRETRNYKYPGFLKGYTGIFLKK